MSFIRFLFRLVGGSEAIEFLECRGSSWLFRGLSIVFCLEELFMVLLGFVVVFSFFYILSLFLVVLDWTVFELRDFVGIFFFGFLIVGAIGMLFGCRSWKIGGVLVFIGIFCFFGRRI